MIEERKNGCLIVTNVTKPRNFCGLTSAQFFPSEVAKTALQCLENGLSESLKKYKKRRLAIQYIEKWCKFAPVFERTLNIITN